MLIYSSQFINMPVVSLRTGNQVATIIDTIVNPFNLTIHAFRLSGRQLNNPHNAYLLPSDIREISRIGLIIDDSQDIVSSDDVIRLKEILDLNFELINLPVIDKKRRKIGRVIDTTIISEAMIIHQLVIKRPLFKDFFDQELIIQRSQIDKISQHQVIIKNELGELRELEKQAAIDNFINPFRNTETANQGK
ncbi:MAG: hypothetical protein Q3996_00075 [Candidatus Saccharibacteria bacterium]|nr:hypothetical protein [Candidatus Saccharibacteria bacterium]